MAKLRLNKILAQAGLSSRRGADRLIADGRVAINGAVTRELATLADPERDLVTVDGRPLPHAAAKHYLVLHKPAGYVTPVACPPRRPVGAACAGCAASRSGRCGSAICRVGATGASRPARSPRCAPRPRARRRPRRRAEALAGR